MVKRWMILFGIWKMMRVSEDGEDGAVDDSNDESWLCLTANPSYAAACLPLVGPSKKFTFVNCCKVWEKRESRWKGIHWRSLYVWGCIKTLPPASKSLLPLSTCCVVTMKLAMMKIMMFGIVVAQIFLDLLLSSNWTWRRRKGSNCRSLDGKGLNPSLL